jgi:8-oxo-dGTP pyrophosphatase MutT (NUDIX family)
MTAALLSERGFPAEGEVFEVSSFRLRVSEAPHPWVLENAAAIESNWQREVAANPRLFNGRMVFQRELRFERGHIEGRAHMVPFAAFLHWRRSGRGDGGHHLFAMPMIASADGAVIAIRMADTTANPGRVYSPAGSLDAHDVKDGLCDLEENMRRETREETGLELDDMTADPICRAVHVANSVAVFRVFRSALDEEALRTRIAAHVAADPEPEISEMVGIRSPDPGAHDYVPFMPPALDWIFREGMK